jgi:hypothetical protein
VIARWAAIEETFMLPQLVIAAPNTWNGSSVPTRLRSTPSRNAGFGHVQHRSALAQRRPGHVPAGCIDEDVDPPYLVEQAPEGGDDEVLTPKPVGRQREAAELAGDRIRLLGLRPMTATRAVRRVDEPQRGQPAPRAS